MSTKSDSKSTAKLKSIQNKSYSNKELMIKSTQNRTETNLTSNCGIKN